MRVSVPGYKDGYAFKMHKSVRPKKDVYFGLTNVGENDTVWEVGQERGFHLTKKEALALLIDIRQKLKKLKKN